MIILYFLFCALEWYHNQMKCCIIAQIISIIRNPERAIKKCWNMAECACAGEDKAASCTVGALSTQSLQGAAEKTDMSKGDPNNSCKVLGGRKVSRWPGKQLKSIRVTPGKHLKSIEATRKKLEKYWGVQENTWRQYVWWWAVRFSLREQQRSKVLNQKLTFAQYERWTVGRSPRQRHVKD